MALSERADFQNPHRANQCLLLHPRCCLLSVSVSVQKFLQVGYQRIRHQSSSSNYQWDNFELVLWIVSQQSNNEGSICVLKKLTLSLCKPSNFFGTHGHTDNPFIYFPRREEKIDYNDFLWHNYVILIHP